jgi:hypothetical protein
VDAFGGLLRLNGVHTEFGFAAFLLDGEDAEGGDGFKGIAGLRVHHADADGDEVAGVDDCKRDDERDESLLDDGANGNQAFSSSKLIDGVAGRHSLRVRAANVLVAAIACLWALRQPCRS